MSTPLPVLYQDDHCVVVHKPSGLLVHRSDIAREATEFAMQIVRDQMGRHVYPVHRLDRPTSGALLFALHPEAARFFTTEFTEQRVEKTYWAVVRGHTVEEFSVDHALKEKLDPISDRKARKDKPAQPARTSFRRLASCELAFQVDKYPTTRYSLVEAKPHTGRKHQIRRHLKHVNHPIVGDVNFGQGSHNRFFQEQFQIRRLLLACTALGFTKFGGNERLQVEAPLSVDFAGLLDKLQLRSEKSICDNLS